MLVPHQLASIPRFAVLPLQRLRPKEKKEDDFGAWYVRTMMDKEASEKPERRTALIAGELASYRIEFAALSETSLADEGSIAEPKGIILSSGTDDLESVRGE